MGATPEGTAQPLAWQVDLFEPFLRALPITGLSISVIGNGRAGSTICVSDVVAGRIDELYFALGEGPHWRSIQSCEPTLVADVATADHSPWPAFGEAITGLGVGAVFSFPLTLGVAVVGVADLYRELPGGLGEGQIETALRLSASASAPVVERATHVAEGEWSRPSGLAPEMRREVQQATGMILVQLDVTAAEAFYRLKAHSYGRGRSLRDVARDVVSRRLNFRDLT